MTARVLVAGVGNIFFGDDGFGVEVAQRLGATKLPDGVQVGDYGTSGMHLAYDLADHGYETTILVVACEPASAEPGMGLSAPVEAAVDEAVALVTRLVTETTSPPAFHQEKTEPQRTESDERAMVAPPARSND